MEDWKAGFRAELRAIEIATADAAAAQLPGLLARLRRHRAALDRSAPGGNPVLAPYHRWRIRRLGRAVAEARHQIALGRLARTGHLHARP